MIKILKKINHEIINNDDYVITIISESSLLKYIKNNICNTTL